MNMQLQSNELFLKWDPAQVATFINTIIKDSDRNAGSLFLDNKIDGLLLPYITTEHLREIGIKSLKTRLVIKKGISDLIAENYRKYPPQSIQDQGYMLSVANVNSNHIALEALNLSTILISDSIRKMNKDLKTASTATRLNSPVGGPSQNEIKKLNDNFNKLKTDLIPVIRMLKDSKPLPTPTLDPRPPTTLVSPSFSTYEQETEANEKENEKRLSGVDSVNHLGTTSTTTTNRFSSNLPSPSTSRFSSGSLLSMGTGKIISQSVSNFAEAAEFKLQKVGIGKGSGKSHDATSNPRPQLINNNQLSNGSLNTVGESASKVTYSRPQLSTTTATTTATNTVPLSVSAHGAADQQSVPKATTGPTAAAVAGSAATGPAPTAPAAQSYPPREIGNEPLKQLRASTDDSCLKILQSAMKRHHIPRDDWSRYVLVICYGDKERILKLAEKPVVIFKELQELGKHPAIMLRQLATAAENQESSLYEDSTIATEIPGGYL
ncbi:uncharacterized protein LODBEIA_P34480 [Lodderomyces beijingensis]|uniref:Ste50p n=1 Tax=Lodderomyces beijingensis TaxID=1775926 RepID=A0ABP0ZM59_9ASCO